MALALPTLTAVIAWAALPQAVDAPRRPCGTQADILVRSDPTLAPIRPADCAVVTQTPPELTWPPQDGRHTYVVSLTHPGGRTESRTTPENWIVWDRALPPGDYQWQVKVKDGETGAPRRFTIAANAASFIVPGDEAALARARQLSHPRSWAKDESSPIAALRAERARAFAGLLDEVEGKMASDVQAEPKAESMNANYEDTVAEQKRTLNAAVAWAVTRQPRYGAEAARRLVAQARWSATGPISYRNNDTASRTVAWTLALGYDWAHDALDEAQRRVILGAIRARMQEMVDELFARNDISRFPYDSHGNMTLTVCAAISALVAGDIPEADEWFRRTVRTAVVWTSPWGGTDGGFANGTMQGQWDTGANLLAWYVLRQAAGVDLARKEWVRNHARYLAYFVPPGAPGGLFGDGQEQRAEETRSRVGKALAAFAPTPIGNWYAHNLRGEDSARLELLLAPRVRPASAELPAGTPNDASFPSIGWVAMHSDLADPKRASVYFKSSPYGSYNHSHADQNSFVIDYRGERLAIDSGYYDDYGTPHWREWYKQTRAANAITFDGGQGQGIDGRQYSGEVTHFESDAKHAVAVGRAEKAYGGALTWAERTVVLERPDVVVVRDVLASEVPRTWEWNIHALEKMKPAGDRKVAIRRGQAAMCVEMLEGPEVAFTQTDRFTVPPGRSSMQKSHPDQWHGVFATREKSKTAAFVTRMKLGSDCS
ncbi:MAG TPA: DUF4962 domain-containing protein [Usitatibacter sp.]|nr:DUF4962 domain-containing protein [Usitatibacter sp.]